MLADTQVLAYGEDESEDSGMESPLLTIEIWENMATQPAVLRVGSPVTASDTESTDDSLPGVQTYFFENQDGSLAIVGSEIINTASKSVFDLRDKVGAGLLSASSR